MNKCCIAILAILCAMLAGCSSTPIVITSEYKGQTLAGDQLAVVLSPPTILNKDDVVDDLGAGIADDVFSKFFHEVFPLSVKKYGRVSDVPFVSIPSIDSLMRRELDIDDQERISVQLPRDGVRLAVDSVKADFILFVSQYAVSRIGATAGTWSQGAQGSAPAYSGGSFEELQHQVEFALWDNTKGRLVSYGRATAESTVLFAMTKGNWESCVNSIAQQIMKGSPFYDYRKSR